MKDTHARHLSLEKSREMWLEIMKDLLVGVRCCSPTNYIMVGDFRLLTCVHEQVLERELHTKPSIGWQGFAFRVIEPHRERLSIFGLDTDQISHASSSSNSKS